MAKLLDPASPVAFTPAWHLDRPEPVRPVYLIRPPRLLDRFELDRAVRARGVRRRGEIELLAALSADAREMLGLDYEASAIRAQIDDAAAALDGFMATVRAGEPLDEAHGRYLAARDALEPAVAAIRQAGGRFAACEAETETFPQYLGIEAARLLLVGWRNVEPAFRREITGVPLDLLEQLPMHDLIAIGAEVERLLEPTPAERKNSASPSPASNAPAISSSSRTPRRTDRSPATVST